MDPFRSTRCTRSTENGCDGAEWLGIGRSRAQLVGLGKSSTSFVGFPLRVFAVDDLPVLLVTTQSSCGCVTAPSSEVMHGLVYE